MELMKYEESAIDKRIIRAVTEMGYEEMTPIQQLAIPAVMEGRDIIGQAQTGTGKTAAFGIPMIQMMDPENTHIQGIIMCPTRELAIQAAEELRHFAKYMHGIKVLPIYGGQDIEKQIRSLRDKITIVVGTPGRMLDHIRRHTLKLENVKMVVLDEADEMLNMGFIEDIETILAEIPSEHQTALFSATMPQSILDITGKYQKDALKLEIVKKELTIPLVKQYYYEVKRQNKEEVVSRLLDYYNPKASLIFCNTKRMVDELTENLKGRGYFAEGLHGDMSQAQRDKVMRGFRTGTIEILIATDVAARGIDVDNVEAVFNYDIPQDNEYYVHRIGRTGRAGRKGRSFTLVVGREIYRIRDIERACNTKIKVRVVPTVADINAAKSQKVFGKVMELINTTDLTGLTKIVQDKLNDEDITAMELCTGFLRLHLGEDKEDIETISFFKDRARERDDSERARRKRSMGANRETYSHSNEKRDYKGRGSKNDNSKFGSSKKSSRKEEGFERDTRKDEDSKFGSFKKGSRKEEGFERDSQKDENSKFGGFKKGGRKEEGSKRNSRKEENYGKDGRKKEKTKNTSLRKDGPKKERWMRNGFGRAKTAEDIR